MPKTAKEKLPATVLKHGILSRNLLLQSESEAEYEEVLAGFYKDYLPVNATECHLVEELAGIIWRKKRLRMAESAYHRRSLQIKAESLSSNTLVQAAVIYNDVQLRASTSSIKDALTSTDEEDEKDLAELEAAHSSTLNTAQALKDKKLGYEEALAVLEKEIQEWWQTDKLGQSSKRGEKYEPCAEHLLNFLLHDALPVYESQHSKVIYRADIKAQAEGEAFIPNDQMEKFTRYEIHLDRKFERTLTVLLRLQEMRINREKNLLSEKIA